MAYRFLAVFLLLAARGAVADTLFFEGTLGPRLGVVMELTRDATGKTYTGRYFYTRIGNDIPLSGSLDHLVEPGRWITEERREAGAVWEGRLDGGDYAGLWKGGNGRAMPFRLHRIDIVPKRERRPDKAKLTAGLNNAAPYAEYISAQSMPYEYRKVSVNMRAGRIIDMGPVAYQMVSETRTRFAYPRLVKHPNPDVLRRVNGLLEQRHWWMMLDALDCGARAYEDGGFRSSDPLGGYQDEKVTVAYLSPTLMTVTEEGSTFCGGAHPNNHFDPFTLDLINGDYLDPNRLFNLLSGADEDIEGDERLSKGLRELIRQVSAEKPAPRAKPDDERDGDETCRDELPNYLAVYFRKPDRLVLGISGIGHAMGVCLGDQISLPFDRLKPILRPAARAYLPQ